MKLILDKGHSRVPVYYEQPINIIGLILVYMYFLLAAFGRWECFLHPMSAFLWDSTTGSASSECMWCSVTVTVMVTVTATTVTFTIRVVTAVMALVSAVTALFFCFLKKLLQDRYNLFFCNAVTVVSTP
ncbi:hypothetical protein PJP10_31150, partial [Mycobacterium kansasii]